MENGPLLSFSEPAGAICSQLSGFFGLLAFAETIHPDGGVWTGADGSGDVTTAFLV